MKKIHALHMSEMKCNILSYIIETQITYLTNCIFKNKYIFQICHEKKYSRRKVLINNKSE